MLGLTPFPSRDSVDSRPALPASRGSSSRRGEGAMTTMHERAQRIAEAIDPRLRVVSTAPATGSFTNDARILECRTPAGSRLRLVAKFLVDKPELASRIAAVSFHAASLAREHGVPVPEPLFLDETGEVLGVPGVVSRLVEGSQVANPESPEKWAEDLACQLVQIHSIRPGERDKRFLFDGNHQTLYFTRDEYPKLMAGHPLSSDILGAVRKLQSELAPAPPVLVHLDYWHGNVLWLHGRISAVLDWDFAGYGDPGIDVAYFRMNMHLRGIRDAADCFLKAYERQSGEAVRNLGFRELAAAAQPLPSPIGWIPMIREMGGAQIADELAIAQYEEFVAGALQRAYEGR